MAKTIKKKAVKRAVAGSKNQHVISVGMGWAVKAEGAATFFTIVDTKQSAVTTAKLLAKTHGSEVLVHGKDGRLLDRISYAGRTAVKAGAKKVKAA
jgi:uncharacterized protein YdaT